MRRGFNPTLVIKSLTCLHCESNAGVFASGELCRTFDLKVNSSISSFSLCVTGFFFPLVLDAGRASVCLHHAHQPHGEPRSRYETWVIVWIHSGSVNRCRSQ